MSRTITEDVMERYAPLGAFIASRFEELAAMNRAPNQSQLARDMGYKSPRQIKKFLEAPWRLRSLKGWQIELYFGPMGLDVLHTSDFKDMLARYDLNMPPSLVPHEAKVQAVAVYVESGVGDSPTRTEPVPVSYLGGTDPSRVRIRYLAATDLVTAAVRSRVQIGHRMLLALGVEPRDGDLVVVEQNGRDALALWPLSDSEYATTLDPQARGEPLLVRAQYAQLARVMLDYGTGRWGADDS